MELILYAIIAACCCGMIVICAIPDRWLDHLAPPEASTEQEGVKSRRSHEHLQVR